MIELYSFKSFYILSQYTFFMVLFVLSLLLGNSQNLFISDDKKYLNY